GLGGSGGVNGTTQIYADYDQWQAQLKAVQTGRKAAAEDGGKSKPSSPGPTHQTKRLSYMDQREYDRIEGDIATAEAELAESQRLLEDPALMSDSQKLLAATTKVEVAQAKVDAL